MVAVREKVDSSAAAYSWLGQCYCGEIRDRSKVRRPETGHSSQVATEAKSNIRMCWTGAYRPEKTIKTPLKLENSCKPSGTSTF